MLLGLFVIVMVTGGSALAQVSHVSINERHFTLGQYPRLRLNLVAESNDLSRLEFVLRQQHTQEKLMVERLNAFMLLATGVEDVTDPKAMLIVKEYKASQWQQYKTFPLFSADERAGAVAASEAEPEGTGQLAMAKAESVKPSPIQTSAQPTKVDADRSEPIRVAMAGLNPEAAAGGECQLEYSAGETLWRIGNRYASQWGVNVYAAILSIYEANPTAFNRQDIKGLKQNARLNCPSRELLSSQGEAIQAARKYQSLQ
jgi:FimV-like protein